MKKLNKKKHYIIISVILSLLVHVFILSLLENIKVKQNFDYDLPRKKSQVITFTKTNIISIKELQALEKKSTISKSISTAPLKPLKTRYKVKPVLFSKNYAITTPQIPVIHPPSNFKPVAMQKITFQPKIIQFDGDKLTEKELEYNHLIIPKIPRKEYSAPLLYNRKNNYIQPTDVADSTQKIMPLKIRVPSPKIIFHKEPTLISETKLLALKKTTPIDPFLKIMLYKYSQYNHGGYFKIIISTNKDAAHFKNFNRDIIFLIDISGSIANYQLAEFVKGIATSIPHLNPEDRFEVVAFKDKPLALFSKMEKPTEKNIKKAIMFLNKLQQSGSTNLYKALEPYVDSKYKTAGRPLLIFMLSDGQLNSGDIVDSRNFINTISNKNHQTASIFTFTNAEKSNTFLLDLLAYRNRGVFTQTGMANSSDVLKKDVISTGSTILKDLNYQISSNLSAETFPKKLPNLYQGRSITLYGQYKPNIDKVSLRITGTDTNGNQHELIYSESLNNALKGSKTLPRQWAQQYIFHLYSKLTAHYSEQTKQKIYSIAKKYSISTSYLNKFLSRPENLN